MHPGKICIHAASVCSVGHHLSESCFFSSQGGAGSSLFVIPSLTLNMIVMP